MKSEMLPTYVLCRRQAHYTINIERQIRGWDPRRLYCSHSL